MLWVTFDLTEVRYALAHARPGDEVQCPPGKTLRPRKPVIVPQGVTLLQPPANTIDESGRAYVND